MDVKLIHCQDFEVSDDYPNVTGICPECGKTVQFTHIKGCKDFKFFDGGCNRYYFGQRICPDKECMTHIFFKMQINFGGPIYTEIIPEKIVLKNLNIDKLPNNVSNCIKEAVACYDNSCYISSAIMIRKTLEEICLLQNAKGKDLHEKLRDLESKITISKPLYDSMFELKYLGNDAAHVISKKFEHIGLKEIRIGLILLTEILRALYEHQDILNELKSLKSN